MKNSIEIERYKFSFTAGSALLQESLIVARLLVDNQFDWDKAKEKTYTENLLQKNRSKTIEKIFSLVKKRLSNLSQPQLILLSQASLPESKILILLAIVKTHNIILDFITEVLRDKYFSFDFQLTQADYNSFCREKEVEHPELSAISESTFKKIKQVTFKILEQTELIDSVKTGLIKKPYISEEIEHAIVVDNPLYLAALLYDNNDIQSAINRPHV